MGPRSVNPKIQKPEKPDPNANGYPNAQAYLHIRGERSGIRSGSDRVFRIFGYWGIEM